MPKLSIICPSFNHEQYIHAFMNSFISQTEKDIELIIVDDCSTDNNKNIIKSYNDSRINLIENNYNMGINSTIKTGILAANSNIIALIASDDILFPNYASTVINIFNENKNIHSFFTTIELIDISGNQLNTQITVSSDYDRFYVLNKLFNHNVLPSPGSAFRKESVLKYATFPAGMFQMQDYYFHIEMLLQYDAYFHSLPLLYYRYSYQSVSTSSDFAKQARESLEKEFMLDLYYNITDVATFLSIFKDSKVVHKYGKPTIETIPFFVALIAIEENDSIHAEWGFKSLIKFYSNNENQKLLYDLYKFQFSDYISEAKYIIDRYSPLYIKITSIRKKRTYAIYMAIISFIINLLFIVYYLLY